jgi:hypothetical protein
VGEKSTKLKQEIEETRDDLSRDVDAVAFKASPQRIVADRVESAKSRVSDLKDRVMGTTHSSTESVRGSAQNATASSSQSLHSAAESARQVPGQVATQVRERAEGNPLAAGLIAFGIGWLVSSLLPASQAETRVAQQGTQLAKDRGAPLLEQAKEQVRQIGHDVGEHFEPAIQEAVESVKATAQQAAVEVKDHGSFAAQTVKDEARSQAEDARAQHTPS